MLLQTEADFYQTEDLIPAVEYHKRVQGVIQGVFEIGNRFWAHENWRPNFGKFKNKFFTKSLISKLRANHKLPPMYKKH